MLALGWKRMALLIEHYMMIDIELLIIQIKAFLPFLHGTITHKNTFHKPSY